MPVGKKGGDRVEQMLQISADLAGNPQTKLTP